MKGKYVKMRAVRASREGAWNWQVRAESVSSRRLWHGSQHTLKDASRVNPTGRQRPPSDYIRVGGETK